jgi:hypothetical protein
MTRLNTRLINMKNSSYKDTCQTEQAIREAAIQLISVVA